MEGTRAAQAPPPIIRPAPAPTMDEIRVANVGAGEDEVGGGGACAALIPRGRPCAALIPRGRPCAALIPRGRPCAALIPRGRPCAALASTLCDTLPLMFGKEICR